eukprot:CAMPEP_0174585310 /NCGR_PEP_ID=MMETSP0929-20130131/21026_1 /TAXON_ID=548131 ORGANISM="Ostreococcus mediterraneus, Strain clade-D-RCC2572" /NCGR_SAMPLE_ID=MMETSP0929 /ASSEMBLY_ACC=CAM_ASM_000573 /LENGTH=32 /DNA_ID= /DNA_START= /DNA_END= /DNA_ORIENTATION=
MAFVLEQRQSMKNSFASAHRIVSDSSDAASSA